MTELLVSLFFSATFVFPTFKLERRFRETLRTAAQTGSEKRRRRQSIRHEVHKTNARRFARRSYAERKRQSSFPGSESIEKTLCSSFRQKTNLFSGFYLRCAVDHRRFESVSQSLSKSSRNSIAKKSFHAGRKFSNVGFRSKEKEKFSLRDVSPS